MFTLTWDEISGSARDIFRIWVAGRELEWAELTWEGLSAHGLTTYRDEVEKSRVLLRLAVLGVLYREFCTQAWDEWDDPMVPSWLADFGIGAFRIAQVAGPKFWHAESESEEQLFAMALDHLLEEERQVVIEALAKHFGSESMLFASLWATNFEIDLDVDDLDVDGHDDEGHEPTLREILKSREALDLILNDEDDMLEERLQAFEWVQRGMPSIDLGRSEPDYVDDY